MRNFDFEHWGLVGTIAFGAFFQHLMDHPIDSWTELGKPSVIIPAIGMTLAALRLAFKPKPGSE